MKNKFLFFLNLYGTLEVSTRLIDYTNNSVPPWVLCIMLPFCLCACISHFMRL